MVIAILKAKLSLPKSCNYIIELENIGKWGCLVEFAKPKIYFKKLLLKQKNI